MEELAAHDSATLTQVEAPTTSDVAKEEAKGRRQRQTRREAASAHRIQRANRENGVHQARASWQLGQAIVN